MSLFKPTPFEIEKERKRNAVTLLEIKKDLIKHLKKQGINNPSNYQILFNHKDPDFLLSWYEEEMIIEQITVDINNRVFDYRKVKRQSQTYLWIEWKEWKKIVYEEG